MTSREEHLKEELLEISWKELKISQKWIEEHHEESQRELLEECV